MTEKLIEKLVQEGLVGPTEAARSMATVREGKRCHPSTIIRWCLHGLRAPDGRIVRLEHVRLGGRIMTSHAAILRFLAAQQDDIALSSLTQPRSPAARDRAADEAMKQLAEMGVG